MNHQDNAHTHILVTGASGLIGSALVPLLKSQGYQVHSLARSANNNRPYWDIEKQEIHLNGVPEPDIIIHLAGLNIGQSRWSPSVKQDIVESRLRSTQLLVDHINQRENPPSLFICASAIGYYGNSGAQPMDETEPQGQDFVSQLAAQWEAVSQRVKQATTRVVNLRTGIVLDAKQGALAKMLPPFKMGVGGKIGSGKQMMSWIDLQDEINAILFIINHPQLTGPVNLVSPLAVNNETFTRTLAKILKRPCLLPLPAFIVKLLFAQMGEELLLSSTHVRPTKLLQAGFTFEYASLEESLKKQLT